MAGAVHQVRNPEIRQQRMRPGARTFEQDVLGFEIAVDHAGAAGGIQRGGDVGGNTDGQLRGQPFFAHQALAQRLAFVVIHHIVQVSVDGAGGVNRHDVRVAQLGDGPSLGQEAARDGGIRGQFRMDHLDGDQAIERQVAGAIDDAHATAPDLAFDPVLMAQRALEGVAETGRRHGRSRGHDRVPRLPIRVASVSAAG